MPPNCALLGGFAIGARVALLWQHNVNPSYKLAFIQQYDDIVRTLGRVCALLAGDWWVMGAFSKLYAVYHKWTWLACRWMAVDGGVLNITAMAWTVGFHWWRSGNVTRMQNVSEYMLVLALCLVLTCHCIDDFHCWFKFTAVFSLVRLLFPIRKTVPCALSKMMLCLLKLMKNCVICSMLLYRRHSTWLGKLHLQEICGNFFWKWTGL